MPSIFDDATGNGYDLTILDFTDWALAPVPMPNGDIGIDGSGSIAPTFTLHGEDFPIGDGTGWTIEFMFRTTGEAPVGQTIAHCALPGGGSSNQAWGLYYAATYPGRAVDLYIFNTFSATYANARISLGTSDTTWHHVVFVIEPGGTLIHGYLDYVLVTTYNVGGGTGTPRTPTSSDRLYVGVSSNGAGSLATPYLGKLAIYHRALGELEVNEHFLSMISI